MGRPIARVSSGCGLTYITAALWQSVFAAVRITERQRRWSLHTLGNFWLAVPHRVHRALSHVLDKMLEGSKRLLDDVKEALNIRPGLRRGVFQQCDAVAQGGVVGEWAW